MRIRSNVTSPIGLVRCKLLCSPQADGRIVALHLLKQCLAAAAAQEDSRAAAGRPVAKVCLVLAETAYGFYQGVARRMVCTGGALVECSISRMLD